MTLQARTKPYPTRERGTYQCGRCGIQRTIGTNNTSGYCSDCAPEARALGWSAPRKPRTRKDAA